jgi:hypothetical protein
MMRPTVWKLLPSVLVLAAVALPSGAGAVSQVNSVLKVVPYYVHGGDLVHVSGAGLVPGKRIDLFLGCPAVFDTTEMTNSNFAFVSADQGPKVDRHGEFVNFTWKAPVLKGVTQSACTVYTRAPDGSTEFGPDIPGGYYTMPERASLPACSKHICAAIGETPSRVRSGRSITIEIRPGRHLGETSWPGARATVKVAYPGNTSTNRTVKLNWEGWGDVRVHVPADVRQRTEATVSANFSMGRLSGHAHAHFLILPPSPSLDR